MERGARIAASVLISIVLALVLVVVGIAGAIISIPIFYAGLLVFLLGALIFGFLHIAYAVYAFLGSDDGKKKGKSQGWEISQSREVK